MTLLVFFGSQSEMLRKQRRKSALLSLVSLHMKLVRDSQRQRENSHLHKLNQTLSVKGSDFKRSLELQRNA